MIILIFLLFVIATGSYQTDSSEEVTAGKRHFYEALLQICVMKTSFSVVQKQSFAGVLQNRCF